MGTVLVIFLFFWTDNDLVCVPTPLSGMSPSHTQILLRITQKILTLFSWNFRKLQQTIWQSRIYNKDNNEILQRQYTVNANNIKLILVNYPMQFFIISLKQSIFCNGVCLFLVIFWNHFFSEVLNFYSNW